MKHLIKYYTRKHSHHSKHTKSYRLINNFKIGDKIAIQFFKAALKSYIKSLPGDCKMLVPVPSSNKFHTNNISIIVNQIACELDCCIPGNIILTQKFGWNSFCKTNVRKASTIYDSIQVEDLAADFDIILIDDITTSGITLDTIADMITKAGAKSVTKIALAKTMRYNQY